MVETCHETRVAICLIGHIKQSKAALVKSKGIIALTGLVSRLKKEFIALKDAARVI